MRVNTANRGMAFEELVEYSNRQYAEKGWASIQKVATPWKVVRRGKQIVSAFPEKKSTVDFVGVANGRAIAFDAKSTRERTRFPLANIEQHQMDFLERFQDQGGIGFFLVEFAKHHEFYIIPFTNMNEYWERARAGGRKSIPYDDMFLFEKVKSGRGIALDYLAKLV